ncbi:MAG: 2-oxo acid dehydrogenase subunit E2, partial [Anaerolineales bacterium]|nr:2-oxo acid dehydrogenase subunit E2 [Anaerolineales bacterium]
IGKEDVEAWPEDREPIQDEARPDAPERIQLTKIKMVTARRMSESKQTAPHFYITADIELDRALALREWYKNQGQEISINDLILKATAIALMRFPSLNAAFIDDEIHQYSNIDLAMAVALDDGLITPVIHHCESLSLVEIAQASRGIIDRARAGRLNQNDLTGGTFTVSNLGMYGVKQFEAIINPPQAAILAVGAVRRMPVYDAQDQLVPRQVITATISADHRVTDGAQVARFLQQVRMTLENGFDLMPAIKPVENANS